MKITEVNIKPANDTEHKVEAYCSLTLDNEFALHDLRIIRRDDSSFFLQMPSRKITDRCANCSAKNYVRARFCNWCGKNLPSERFKVDQQSGRPLLTADIFHPITKEARAWMQEEVLRENENSKVQLGEIHNGTVS